MPCMARAVTKYRCGLVETTKHLIQDCSLYRAERKALYKKIRDKLGVVEVTLPILLYSRFGIKHLLVFLEETNICSKNWHINRGEEEEEEDSIYSYYLNSSVITSQLPC